MACTPVRIGIPTRDQWNLLRSCHGYTGSWDEYVSAHTHTPDGFLAIVCHSGEWDGSAQCSCLAFAGYLCDYPVGDDKTCDRPLCPTHAHQVGADLHYCPDHHKEWLDWMRREGADPTLMARHGGKRP